MPTITGWDVKQVGDTIELRKTFYKVNKKGHGKNMASKWDAICCQALVVVSRKAIKGFKSEDDKEDCNIIISMNGKCGMSFREHDEMNRQIGEAITTLWHQHYEKHDAQYIKKTP